MRLRAKHIATGVALSAMVIVGVIAWWLPSEQELARRVEQAASERLGVPVTVCALYWQLLPRPLVVVENAATQQRQPMRVDRLTLTPSVSALLAGEVKLDSVTIEGGVIATRSMHALKRGRQAEQTDDDDGPEDVAEPAGRDIRSADRADDALQDKSTKSVDLAHLAFRNLTWISRTGIPVEYEGELDFAPGLQLQQAHVRRPGLTPVTDIAIARVAGSTPEQQRFDVKSRVGGGRADGQALVRRMPDGSAQLSGELAPTGVEVQNALAAFNRRSAVAGRASGRTLLSAQAHTVFGLAGALHTDTTFTMAPATLVRFDLGRAIKTLGREHQGQTTLEELVGRVETQNSRTGMGIRFSDIKARSGALTASGAGTMKNRYLKARGAVDLVDGVVGVPLRIEGPIKALKVSVAGGAIAGAVAGTAVLPGIGTVIGAAIGRVFSGDGPDDLELAKDRKPGDAPAKTAPPSKGTPGHTSPH